jgi:hypothetical protein
MGLREMGLPYAHDPAITRHLAEFIGRFGRMPTHVLFNGGVMKAAQLQARITELLCTWASRDVRVLAGADLDLAVALGAAHYGQVRAGKGVRIRGGTARAYYIGIESSMPAIPGFAPPIKALCVAPQGLEEGSTVELPDDELGLVVGELSNFRFFAAATRKDDGGALVGRTRPASRNRSVEAVEADAERNAGDMVPVRLEAQVTELGTLELWCVARDGRGRWKLEYSVRERDWWRSAHDITDSPSRTRSCRTCCVPRVRRRSSVSSSARRSSSSIRCGARRTSSTRVHAPQHGSRSVRVAVIDLPPPQEMGEAYFVAIVGHTRTRATSATLLEHD